MGLVCRWPGSMFIKQDGQRGDKERVSPSARLGRLGLFPAEFSSQNGNGRIDLCLFLKTLWSIYELNYARPND